MLSYLDGVCHKTNNTFWFMHNDTEEYDEPHPNDVAHDLIARLLIAVVAKEVDSVCLRGDVGEDDAGAQQHHAELDARTTCLASPAMDVDARRDGKQAFNVVGVDEQVWSFYEDVEKKAGWIANATIAPAPKKAKKQHGPPTAAPVPPVAPVLGNIGLGVVLKQGWIQLEVLGTYKDIGTITCWIDADAPASGNTCLIDALWDDKYSMSRFFYMRANVKSGQHTLWCRSDGRKFKILSIASC